MPIYEYECKDCGKTFELFRGIKDDPLTACVHCNGAHVRKLVSHCSFQLKGTGWYATDYAKKDSNNGTDSHKKESRAKTTEANKSSEKSESSSAKTSDKAASAA